MEFDRVELGEDSSGSVVSLVLCRSKGGPYDDDAFSRSVMTAVDPSPAMVPAPVVPARAASPRVRIRALAVDSLAPTTPWMER
jgi:hypothetical protein